MGDISSGRTEGVPRNAEGRAIESLAVYVVALEARLHAIEAQAAFRAYAEAGPHWHSDSLVTAWKALHAARASADTASLRVGAARGVVNTLAGLPADRG